MSPARRIVDLRRGEVSEVPIRLDDPFPARSAPSLIGRTIWRTRAFLVPAAIGAILHQAAEAMVPVLMGLAIDSAVVEGDRARLLMWLVLLAVNFAVLATAFRFGSWFGQFGAETMQHQMRTTVTAKLLSPRARSGRLAGSALSLATNDVRRVTSSLALMVYPVGDLAAIVIGGAFLLAQSLWLGLAVLAGVPLLLVLLDLGGRPLRRRAAGEAEALADTAGAAADLFQGHRVLQGIRAVPEANRRYLVTSRRALRATMLARRSEIELTALLDALSGVFLVAVAVAAGLLAVAGDLTIGALITVVGLTQFLIGPITNLASRVAPIWSTGQASARRLLELMDEQDATGTVCADGPSAPLTLQEVVLAGASPVTLALGEGEFVGVRASSAVLAALADVLAARREAESGEAWAGGYRLTPDDPLTARRQLLVAPHEADLFEGTIADNLALVTLDSGLIGRALAASAAEDVIAAVPGGLDAAVGEAGLRLSGGQRQRIALARALAADADLLVLHEPTTAVDSVTEARIARGVRAMRAGRTTLILTTSPALLAVADRVVAIEEDR